MADIRQGKDAASLIASYVSTHPGTNLGRTGTALNAYFSTSHIHATIRTMIARGLIRAERDEINHYRLFIDSETV